jgi:hypothetical protein
VSHRNLKIDDKERTKYRVRLRVFITRIHTNQRTKVVVLDFVLVAIPKKQEKIPMFDFQHYYKKKRKSFLLPFTKIPPSPFPIVALHPRLVKLDHLLMTLLRKLRKSLDRMIKNLIIQFRQLEVLWLDFLKKVPIGLGVFDSSDCESAFAYIN